MCFIIYTQFAVGGEVLFGTNSWCAVNTSSKNNFYLCGDDGSGKDLKCSGKNYSALRGHTRKWLSNKEEVKIGDTDYVCCKNSNKSTGVFYKKDGFVPCLQTDILWKPEKMGAYDFVKTNTIYICGREYLYQKNGFSVYMDNAYYKIDHTQYQLVSAKQSQQLMIGDKMYVCCMDIENAGYFYEFDANKECVPTWYMTSTLYRDKIFIEQIDKEREEKQAKDVETAEKIEEETEVEIEEETYHIKITKQDMYRCFMCTTSDNFKTCCKAHGEPKDKSVRKSCYLD